MRRVNKGGYSENHIKPYFNHLEEMKMKKEIK